MHDSAHVNSCWHLITFQAARDEVTGFYPIAYEDMNTEARLFMSWHLIYHKSVLSALFWLFSVLQMLWEELQILRAPPLTYGLNHTLRQADNKKEIGVKLSLLRYFVFELIWIGLYWFSWFQPLMS